MPNADRLSSRIYLLLLPFAGASSFQVSAAGAEQCDDVISASARSQ
jgi:hypothetical protein